MMKHKMFALILALTVVSWAQTSTQAPTQPPAEKAKCTCCDKMGASDAKGSGMACERMSKDAKATSSCCGGKDGAACCGKDGKSCLKDDKSASCCKGGGNDAKDKTASACCGSDCKEGCCSKTKMEHANAVCCHHEKSA